jgi:phosphatidylglycerol:prolipoprotein diacylglycerol transferase
MIPYFTFTTIPLGPLTLQVWGLAVALGMLAGLALFYSQAKKKGLSTDLVLDIGIYSSIGGIIVARLFHIFLYEPAYYFARPQEMIAVWHGGMSSLGGFVGAALGIAFLIKKRKLGIKDILVYVDSGVLGLWLGWGIGRIGCFLIHDHPGTLSHFFLAVHYPGGARHDLGLYDSLLAFSIFGVFWFLAPRLHRKRPGGVFIFSALSYAFVRFFFDFLRIVDVRYGYLTPAQWGMLVVVFVLTFAVSKSTVRQPN